jgi:hypothetical protein
MQISVIEKNQVKKTGHYRDLFPDTSFSEQGPSAQFLQEQNCKIINYFKPHDKETQKLVSVQPYLENDEVYGVEVQPITEQEQQAKTNAKAAELRNQRNHLISASDWTQLADSPADKAAWATYRQALRDIPQQEGFPSNVTWPTPPA